MNRDTGGHKTQNEDKQNTKVVLWAQTLTFCFYYDTAYCGFKYIMEASCNDENVLKKQYTLRFDL